MPIYICKQCGNLTEAGESDQLFCSNCGASLGPAQLPEKPGASKPRPSAPPKPAVRPAPPPKPVTLPSAPPKPAARPAPPPKPGARPSPPPARIPTELEKEEELSPLEARPEQTSESPHSQTPSQQTEISLDSAELKEPPPPESTGQEGSPESTIVPALDVYEDKELVICPTCGYGCNVAWPTCPICGAQIAGASDLKKITEVKFDENPIDENLVQCSCGYFCDPNWGTCPICQSKLDGAKPVPKEKETKSEEPESEPEKSESEKSEDSE